MEILKYNYRLINWPIILTWTRIILVPFFILIFYLPNAMLDDANKNIIAGIIFIVAGITDYLDGYLARKLQQESLFGAFLDPVADKVVIVSALIILIDLHRTFMLAVIIIIIREIAISSLREWIAKLGGNNITVAYIGKVKTLLQFFAISLLIFDYHTRLIGNVFMLIAVIFTIISMIYYLQQAKKYFYNS